MSYDPNQPQPPDSGQQPQPSYGQPPSYYGQPQQPPFEQQWGQQPPQDYAPTQNVAPAYGTQSVPGYPGYIPPQQPKRSRRGLWIVLAIIGGLVVLGCAACGILFATGVGFFAKTVAGPAIVVNQYYGAVEKQDYSTAYSYISTNLNAANGQNLTQQLYTTAAQALDTVKGKVSNYSVGNVSATNNTTSVTVSVTRANAPPYDVHLELQQVNGAWKITSYDNI
jgi:hypothetical protein